MSAKFLHGISDDPELEKQFDKQIGCMTGFLQLFDRHQILTGKRLYGPKRLAAARSCSNSSRLDANAASAQNASSEDGQRPSVDSHISSNTDSRPPSIDCNDSTRQPLVCKEQVGLENLETAKTPILTKAMENSGRLSADSRDVGAAGVRESSKSPLLSREQPRASLDLSMHSLDIRDLVRGSFHRDVPRSSTDIRIVGRVQSRVDATKYHWNQSSPTDGRDTAKNIDPIDVSPKSLSKSKEEAHASSDVGKLAMGATLTKGTRNGMDNKQPKKSSLGSNEDLRFSNDGRESLQTSLFEYKDACRSPLKLREAPRLSLDSRARLDQRGGLYAMEIRGCSGNGHTYEHPSEDLQEMGGGKRRSPSVVARLMGLEALPASTPTAYKRAELRRSASESRANRDIFQYRYTEANNSQLKSSMDARKNSSYKAFDAAPRQVFSSQEPQEISSFALPKTYQSHQFQSQFDGSQSSAREKEKEMLQQTFQCPDGSIQDVFSPPLKQSEAVPKPINMQRSVIETAPWRQQESRTSFRQRDFEAKNFFPENRRHSPKGTAILYSEIRRRLEEGGLAGSGKDLETLNQILEAMQLKGLLHSQKNKEMRQHQQAGFPRQNDLDHVSRMRSFHELKMLAGERAVQGKLGRKFEAPIVIMKPSKLLRNRKPAKAPETLSNQTGSVGYGSPQIGNKGNTSNNNVSGDTSRAKTRGSKNHIGNEISLPVRQRPERIANESLQGEANTRRSRTSASSQSVPRTPQSSSGVNGVKNPSLLSPNRQRITKAETERKVKHAGNIVKEREDNRGSPGMHSPKSARQGNGKKTGSDNENKSPRSKMKVQEVYAMEFREIEKNERMDNSLRAEISPPSDGKGSTISHMDVEKSPTLAQGADGKNCVGEKVLDCCDELSATTDIPEQPSPVSVLDTSFYKEECSPSPVMKRFINFKEDETRQQDDSDHGTWNHLSFITRQCQLDELKLDDPVVAPQKPLETSNDVILKPEMDSVGSNLGLNSFPCSNSKPSSEFYYITDILSVSGLLEDRTNISTVLYSSDFPVDPKLFIVLEQRQADLSSSELRVGQDSCLKAELAKMNRQLIFNTVNNILSRKLLPYIHPHPWIYPRYRIQRRPPSGKELLKQVWDEFRCLSAVLSEDICETLCTILQKDLSETLDSWSDHTTEFAEAVLDIERMIFKDLIDETLRDMTSVSGKCRLSLFAATPRRQLLFI